jgi:hypothetical protein
MDDVLKVRKRWTRDSVEMFYRGAQVEDDKLRQDFTKLKKPELESLIGEFDPAALTGLTRNEERVEWLKQRAASAPHSEDWIPVPPSQLEKFLPRFERYRAIDYSTPESLVMKTLRQVYEQVIFEEEVDDDGHKLRRLDKRLSEVQADAEKSIREKVQELQEFVKRYAPRVQDVSFEPAIDFSGGLRSGEFQISDGRGLHYLSKVGDGTKRRIFTAVLDWDRDVSLSQVSQGYTLRPIIRGYDEPDTNLHYEAQRLMYQAIATVAYAQDSHIQVVLCTHSLTMIDRAPAKDINLLRIENGCTAIEKLETDGDNEVEEFLGELAQQLGITNTVMFYERCFVLIEGETEEYALPIIYRNLFGRSLLEDGIRLINLKGNGATGEFLRLLGRNRQRLAIAFLDRDTNDADRGQRAKLTTDAFQQSGFCDNFISERIIYVGQAEFEDAFADNVLVRALQYGYPKDEGEWHQDNIAAIRQENKFSDKIQKLVFHHATNASGKFGKPEFGKYLGRMCTCQADVPEEVMRLFNTARHIAGCSEI